MFAAGEHKYWSLVTLQCVNNHMNRSKVQNGWKNWTVVQVNTEKTGQDNRDRQKLNDGELKTEICIRNENRYKMSKLTKIVLFLYFEIYEDCPREGLDEKFLSDRLCV